MDCVGVRTLDVYVDFAPGTFKVYTLFPVSHAALISLDCLLPLISIDIISYHRIYLFRRTYSAQDKRAEAMLEGEISHPRDSDYRYRHAPSLLFDAIEVLYPHQSSFAEQSICPFLFSHPAQSTLSSSTPSLSSSSNSRQALLGLEFIKTTGYHQYGRARSVD